MANICVYKGIVKGRKNACYAFFGALPCLNDQYIVEEYGDDQNYTIQFEGDCKWSINMYCSSWKEDFQIELPEDYSEAEKEGWQKYSYIDIEDLSKMFKIEVWCNYADIDDPSEDVFMHFRNGEEIYDECPESIGGITEAYLITDEEIF